MFVFTQTPAEYTPHAGRDLPARRRPRLKWNTPQAAKDSIDQLFADVEGMALDTINWYNRRKRLPAMVSRLSRGVSIGLIALGGLCPLLGSDYSTAGYVSFGIAAALLLTDRYGGFSNAWMRYVSTNMRLQRVLQSFQIEWQITRSQLDFDPAAAAQNGHIVKLLEQLLAFVSKILTEVEQETETWMAEFRDSLAQLQRSIREQQQQQTTAKPGAAQETKATGSIIVTVTNFAAATQPVHVLVDDTQTATMSGNSQEIPALAPGTHKVTVRTMDGTNAVEETASVPLDAGQKVVVLLKLTLAPTASSTVVGAAAGQSVAPAAPGLATGAAQPAAASTAASTSADSGAAASGAPVPDPNASTPPPAAAEETEQVKKAE